MKCISVIKLLLTFLLISVVNVYSQNGFVFNYSSLNSNSITDIIESDVGGFFISIGKNAYNASEPQSSTILKISSNGLLLDEFDLVIADSIILINQIHWHPTINNKLIAVGVVYPDGDQLNRSFIKVSLNTLSGAFYYQVVPLPGYQTIAIMHSIIDPHNNIIIAGSVQTQPNNIFALNPYLLTLDLDGNLLNYVVNEWPNTQFTDDVSIYQQSPLKYGVTYTGVAPEPASFSFFAVYDSLLLLEDIYSLPVLATGGNVTSMSINEDVRMFTGRQTTVHIPHNINLNARTPLLDQDVAILLTDQNLQLINHIILGAYDTVDYHAPQKGSDYYQEFIFNAFSSNIKANQFPYQTSPSWIIITKLDTDLNIIWQKYYGGDAHYVLYGIIPSSDGGCVMLGTRFHPDNPTGIDGYILKVGPDGLVSVPEVPGGLQVKEVIVFPNPGSTHLNIQTGHENLEIRFYSANGSLHHLEKVNRFNHTINTASWPAGAYIYQIYKNESLLDNGKWLKAE
jgi:hypothetical protein